MDSITATNAVALNCDDLTNKVLGLSHRNYNKYEILTKSCQDRIITASNIAIDLVSYLINLCATFGWQSAHTIYCAKFIRLNQRALMHHIKTLGIEAAKNVHLMLCPIISMTKRKSDIRKESCNNHGMEITYETKKATNDSYTPSNDATEEDNISMEILWEPQTGTQVTADIVFVHGLHGSSDSTWKQGEWIHKPQTADENCIEIKQHENLTDSNAEAYRQVKINAGNTLSSCNIDSLSECWPKDWLPLDFPTAHFPTIMELHRRFLAMCRIGILKMDIFSFIEMKFTELSILWLRIIGFDTGDPGIGGVCRVPLDHLDVCKPRNRHCFLYRQLADMIRTAMKAHRLSLDDSI